MPCIWLGHIGEYHLRPSRMGAIPPFPVRPTASGVRGVVLTPFSQDSDGIPQYVLARLTVLLQYQGGHVIEVICSVFPRF